MPYYRRHLPHLYEMDQPVFVTWRLQDSLPPGRSFSKGSMTAGQSFAAMDRLLDETREGCAYLKQAKVAQIVVDAILYNERVLKHYELHAFVVMPNRVHLLVSPIVALPKLTRSLKGITAKRANDLLGLTGPHFWAEESYDHLVRNVEEFERIGDYIEYNPVRAGLARNPEDFPFSSASATGGSRADLGGRPTAALA